VRNAIYKSKKCEPYEENSEAGEHGNSVQQPMPYQFPPSFWVVGWRHILLGIQNADIRGPDFVWALITLVDVEKKPF